MAFAFLYNPLGASGYSGFSSYSGYSGGSGYSGLTGASGYSGISGFSGSTGGSIYGRTYFFEEVDSDQPPYEVISLTPGGGGSTINDDIAYVNSTNSSPFSAQLIDGYLTPLNEPGVIEIPSGLWDIEFYRYVNSLSAAFVFSVYTYSMATSSTGTFILSADSGPVTDTSSSYQKIGVVTSGITVLSATDRILVTVSAYSNSVTTVSAHFIYNGSTQYSVVRTPIGQGVSGFSGYSGAGYSGFSGFSGDSSMAIVYAIALGG